jgi:hypothetical protein
MNERNVKTNDYGPNGKASHEHSSFTSRTEVGCISVATKHLKATAQLKDLSVLPDCVCIE